MTAKPIQRVFTIANFADSKPRACRIDPRHWCKGLLRNGVDVQRFSYRDIHDQFVRWPFRKLGRRLSRDAVDRALVEQIRVYHPDLILIMCGKGFGAETIAKIRAAAPDVPIFGRDIDAWPATDPSRIEIARNCDGMTVTDAGEWMEFYKSLGLDTVAFFPCPCDPDIHRPYPADAALAADVVFTGKGHHAGGLDADRAEILRRLGEMPNARLYGSKGHPRVEGIDCFRAFSNAKIVLSINADNTIPRYHSDRFVTAMASGSMVLAKRVPEGELLFRDHDHLRYFDTAAEFFELLEYYLAHDDEREAIAAAGMKRCHEEFNCTRMAGLLLDLVQTGTYSTEWAKQL